MSVEGGLHVWLKCPRWICDLYSHTFFLEHRKKRLVLIGEFTWSQVTSNAKEKFGAKIQCLPSTKQFFHDTPVNFVFFSFFFFCSRLVAATLWVTTIACKQVFFTIENLQLRNKLIANTTSAMAKIHTCKLIYLNIYHIPIFFIFILFFLIELQCEVCVKEHCCRPCKNQLAHKTLYKTLYNECHNGQVYGSRSTSGYCKLTVNMQYHYQQQNTLTSWYKKTVFW